MLLLLHGKKALALASSSPRSKMMVTSDVFLVLTTDVDSLADECRMSVWENFFLFSAKSSTEKKPVNPLTVSLCPMRERKTRSNRQSI